jgi:HflK protein
MVEFFSSIYDMFFGAAFYLLIGFGAAGLLRYFLSEERFLNWFGRDDFGSVMLASLAGVPLPLCSCSVLPVAVAMKKRGASKGAVTSFLISTPESGVDSIMLTYALLDPILTVARPVAALVTAVFTGSMVNWFTRRGILDDDPDNGEPGSDAGDSADGAGCGCSGGKPEEEDAADGESCCSAAPAAGNGKNGFIRRALRYGYVTLLDDLVSVLTFAFLCSGLIAIAVPDSLFESPLARGFPSMLIMLVVGIPFYICATASTPIAATLLLKGLSPGAALVFLLAGPATNLGSLFALSKYLGRKTLALYLICVAGVTLFLGALVDSIYTDYGVDPAGIVGQGSEMIPFWLKAASAALMLALMVRAAWKTNMLRQWGENLRKLCRPLRFDPLGRGARAAVIVLVVVLYGLTGFSVVDVGETGWVLTFGKVTRTIEEPGLHAHWPFPFARVETCRPSAVRTLDFGFQRDAGSGGAGSAFLRQDTAATELEAEMMNGEESIVSVRFSVHYRLSDPYRYTFRSADPDGALRAFAASALREISARLTTEWILIGHRTEMEEMARALIQEEADAAGLGVEILRVTFWDVHAPPSVHYAFRDVASAAEDKHKKKLEAESVLNATVALARGMARRMVEEAGIYRDEKVSAARGEAAAFSALAAAFREAPALTRLRLYLQTMEAVLSRARTVVPLGDGIDVELWMKERAGPPFLEDEEGAKEKEGADGTRLSPDVFNPFPAPGTAGNKEETKESPFREFMKDR